MMLPCVLRVGVGSRRRVWLPLPALVLWPLWLVGWVVWAPARTLRLAWAPTLRAALTLCARVSGLRADVGAADGARIHLRCV